MTKKTALMELSAIRERARRTEKRIEYLSHDLFVELAELRQAVREYNMKRIEFFEEEFRTRKLTWCTRCLSTIPENEAEFILLEGKEEYTHGYQNFYYGFRDFSKLHRACAHCRLSAYDKHGAQGPYSSQAKDRASFYAFRVEKREDGYYIRKFGNWLKLDAKHKLPDLPNEVVKHLAGEWDLPPLLEIDREGKMTVHERVAMTEAV